MSTKKHTAGPWEMHTDAHGRGLIYAESRWLATTWRANGEGNDAPYLPSEANARLIAAAPEMLEALKISRGNVASLNAAHPAIWGEWLKVIDAAISKAEAAQ